MAYRIVEWDQCLDRTSNFRPNDLISKSTSSSNSNTNKLLLSCQRGDWNHVLERIYSHPEEVVDICLQSAVRATCYHKGKRSSNHPTSSSVTTEHQHNNTTAMICSTTSSTTTQEFLSLPIIQALLQVNPYQISIVHRLTGTIVHEAIQYFCTNPIIYYLLQYIVQYQSCHPVVLDTLNHRVDGENSVNLLTIQDDIGRTMLHCMAGRWQRLYVSTSSSASYILSDPRNQNNSNNRNNLPVMDGADDDSADENVPTRYCIGDNNRSSNSVIDDVQLFCTIHSVNPQQAYVHDHDGYTPLLLLLQTPSQYEWPTITSTPSVQHHQSDLNNNTTQELEILSMIQCMVNHNPIVVTYECETLYERTTGNTKKEYYFTPLFYALLYRRSYEIVQLLIHSYNIAFIQQNEQQHNEGCPWNNNHENNDSIKSNNMIHPNASKIITSSSSSIIITQYKEMAVHVAITTMSPIPILQLIVNDYPSGILHQDLLGCTAIDWLWFCYIREYQYILLNHQTNQRHHQLPHHPINHPPNDPIQQIATDRLRRLVSRRRQLPQNMKHWYEFVYKDVCAYQQSLLRLNQQQFNIHTIDDDIIMASDTMHRNERSTLVYMSMNHLSSVDDGDDVSLIPTRNQHPNAMLQQEIQQLNDDIYQRIQIVLLSAAPIIYHEHEMKKIRFVCHCRIEDAKSTPQLPQYDHPWHILHAACYVSCPITMIHLILAKYYGPDRINKNQKYLHPTKHCMDHDFSYKPHWDDDPIRYQDIHTLRYALHYAASRVSYYTYYNSSYIPFTMHSQMTSSSPLNLHMIHETITPIDVILPLYPIACRIVDRWGQLPFHIAIDTYKQHRMDQFHKVHINNTPETMNRTDTSAFYEQEEDHILQLLLYYYPHAISQKDGISQLYPFQQAAVTEAINDGTGSSCEHGFDGTRLTTIYQLLRYNPSVLLLH